MKKKEWICTLEEYDRHDELSTDHLELLKRAEEAASNAYAPYSKFFVGCAVRLKSGEIITGSNQENAAYPSGLCAERVALFTIGNAKPGAIIESLAVTARSADYKVTEPVKPCGACLQVMLEATQRQEQSFDIILGGESEQVWLSRGIQNLLPLQFRLKKD